MGSLLEPGGRCRLIAAQAAALHLANSSVFPPRRAGVLSAGSSRWVAASSRAQASAVSRSTIQAVFLRRKHQPPLVVTNRGPSSRALGQFTRAPGSAMNFVARTTCCVALLGPGCRSGLHPKAVPQLRRLDSLLLVPAFGSQVLGQRSRLGTRGRRASRVPHPEVLELLTGRCTRICFAIFAVH